MADKLNYMMEFIEAIAESEGGFDNGDDYPITPEDAKEVLDLIRRPKDRGAAMSPAHMKTEYAIFKMHSKKNGGPEYWEGPWTSQKKCLEILKRTYDEKVRGRPAFAVFQITYERVS